MPPTPIPDPEPYRDFFALYGLQPRFQIDLQQLEQAWRALQHTYHPDRCAAGPASTAADVLGRSALINEGYRVLRQDATRARHVLELQGLDVEKTPPLPVTFLLRQMTWHESVERAAKQGNVSQLNALREEVLLTMGSLSATLATLLDQQQDYLQAAARLQEFGFYQRLQETIDNALEVLEDS